jgi:hypothetical protein
MLLAIFVILAAAFTIVGYGVVPVINDHYDRNEAKRRAANERDYRDRSN